MIPNLLEILGESLSEKSLKFSTELELIVSKIVKFSSATQQLLMHHSVKSVKIITSQWHFISLIDCLFSYHNLKYLILEFMNEKPRYLW